MEAKDRTELFRPVETKRAPEIVFEALQEKIRAGEYPVGTRLPSERALMKVFDRSHPTIREALRLLESAGYIEVVPGGGAEIKPFRNSQIEEPLKELLVFRKVTAHDMMEFFFSTVPEIGRIAAVRRTWEDLAVLEKLASAIEGTVRELETAGLKGLRTSRGGAVSGETLLQELTEFHQDMIRSAHNPLMTVIWSGLIRLIVIDTEAAVRRARGTGALQSMLAVHRDMMKNIRLQNPDGTAEAIGVCFDSFLSQLDLVTINTDQGEDQPNRRSYKASEAIYDQIRGLILDGQLKPGDRLPAERQLVEAFGKSRAAVREALKMLELKNYVTILRGSGTVVNDISTSELERALDSMLHYSLISKDDIMAVRNLTETIAAEWAAARRTEEDIRAIREALLRSERNIGDRQKLIDDGIDFTAAVAHAAHNEAINVITRSTSIFLHERYRPHAEADRMDEHLLVIRQHTKILREIEKGNVTGAREATRRHLENVSDMLI